MVPDDSGDSGGSSVCARLVERLTGRILRWVPLASHLRRERSMSRLVDMTPFVKRPHRVEFDVVVAMILAQAPLGQVGSRRGDHRGQPRVGVRGDDGIQEPVSSSKVR
jgi:hypothetical protein